jgi:hypothetical protein
LIGCLLALVMTWPLVAHTDSVPGELQDPLLEAWTVAWGGHAVLHQPLHFFAANVFWPLRDTLAFTDSLAGYAPLGLGGGGPGAAVVRYDILFLLAYALAFLGAYLLARELGLRPVAAAVAGAAFAYAPWRLSQIGHLHVLSSGGIPLALFLLARGYRTKRAPLVLGGWLAAAWQISLGWNLGLQFAYALAVIAIGVLGFWFAVGRPYPGHLVLGSSVVGIVCLLAVATLLARPYLRVLDAFPEAKRTPDIVAYFSPPPRAFLAAPSANVVWGGATGGVRDDLAAPDEQTLFPGALVLVLALAGLAGTSLSGRVRAGLAAAVLVTAVYSLGTSIRGSSIAYGFLYEHAPGWQGLRTPGRITTLTTLGLALLAAAGLQTLVSPATRRWAVAVGAAAVLVVLAEGYGTIDRSEVPQRPASLAAAGGPLLELPIGIGRDDAVFMLWSTAGFPGLANGWSGFTPSSYLRLVDAMRGFPDAVSVSALRALGVRTVVLHPGLARGTPWRNAAAKPVGGLGLTVRHSGAQVLYTVEPA